MKESFKEYGVILAFIGCMALIATVVFSVFEVVATKAVELIMPEPPYWEFVCDSKETQTAESMDVMLEEVLGNMGSIVYHVIVDDLEEVQISDVVYDESGEPWIILDYTDNSYFRLRIPLRDWERTLFDDKKEAFKKLSQ